MLVIKVGKKENIKQIRENKYFEKPSAVRRKKKLKAIFQKNWELKNGIDVQ